MPTNRLQLLHDAGQSIWLDFIDRVILRNGDLQRRIRDDALTGMTSNPTIFEKSLAQGDLYDDQIRGAPASSSAMEPTLHCGQPGPGCRGTTADHMIVDVGKPVKRGDIIVFQTPKAAAYYCGAGGTFIKRIVGLPGNVINTRPGSSAATIEYGHPGIIWAWPLPRA